MLIRVCVRICAHISEHSRILPIMGWLPGYQPADLRRAVAAGLTVGAMLVPHATAVLGLTALVVLLVLKRVAPRLPAALLVVAGSIVAVRVFNLEDEGVRVVGDIPDSLSAFGLPDVSGSLIGDLAVTAVVITIIGFMESIAVAKVYARRHRYEVEPNSELIGLGAANVAAGLFGGYPVTDGFSRTAVNDTACARTPLTSLVTAGIVLATIAFFTPLLTTLPNAVLGHVDGTTSYRNVARFPEVEIDEGIRIIRIDAAVSFINASTTKRLVWGHAQALTESLRARSRRRRSQRSRCHRGGDAR